MAINLDHSYIGPYLKDWLKYIRESSDAEQQVIAEGNEFRIPYAGVQVQMVRSLFVLSSRCNVEPQAKYLAVHLLDRYMSNTFWDCMSVADLSEASVRELREKMSYQIKLVMASCLQIASKVDLYKTVLGISQIQELLHIIDPKHEYSKTGITACELRILKSLDFRLPVGLPIHTVEVFLAYSDLSANVQIRDICLHLLDIAYLRHDEIFQQLYSMARGRRYDKSNEDCRDFLSLEANAAFLGASVVVCSNFFLHLKRRLVESLAAKLAGLIEMSPVDVNIMANILFTYAIDEDDFKMLQRAQSASGDNVD